MKLLKELLGEAKQESMTAMLKRIGADAFKQVFGEDPKNIKTKIPSSYQGVRIFLFPSTKTNQYFLDRLEKTGEEPSTHGHVDKKPDAKLVKLANAVKTAAKEYSKQGGVGDVRVYYRKKRKENTPQPYIEVMFARHPVMPNGLVESSNNLDSTVTTYTPEQLKLAHRLGKKHGVEIRSVKGPARSATFTDKFVVKGPKANVQAFDDEMNEMIAKKVTEALKPTRFTDREFALIVKAARDGDELPSALQQKVMNFTMDNFSEQMPYGVQKARDGDPYEWMYDHMSDIAGAIKKMGLVDVMEGKK